MIFLILTDTHFTKKEFIGRKDETLKSQIHKLKKIKEKVNNIDYILHSGDFFDNPTPSFSLINEILDKFPKNKTFITPGNHDLINENIQSLDKTAINLLNNMTNFEILSFDTFIVKDEKTEKKVQISAIPYLTNLKKLDFKIKIKKKVDYSILLLHAPVTFKKMGMDGVISTHDLKKLGFDLIVCGHVHNPFFIRQLNKTKFISPGSFTRTLKNRDVYVGLLKLEKKTANVDLIKIPPLVDEPISHKLTYDSNKMVNKNDQFPVENTLELMAQTVGFDKETIDELNRILKKTKED